MSKYRVLLKLDFVVEAESADKMWEWLSADLQEHPPEIFKVGDEEKAEFQLSDGILSDWEEDAA